MKRILNSLKGTLTAITLCLLTPLAFFTSCQDPVEPERDPALRMMALEDTVSCDPQLKDKRALQITWTAGTNHGSGSAISYTMEIDLEDGAFANPVQLNIGRTIDRTLMLSHRQLSDTICKYFPQTLEETYYTFILRMRAYVVLLDEEQVSEPIKVVIRRTAQMIELLVPEDMKAIDCLPVLGDEEVLHVSWSKGSNHGTENDILYKVDLAQDNTFATGLCLESDTNELQLSNTELAQKLTETFPSMNEGEPYTFYLRIRALIGETEEVQYSQVETMVIRKHSESTVPLYLIGTAMPNGWDKDRATFIAGTWKGELKRGEFKLILSKDGFYPCYVADKQDETKMLLKEEENSGPDDLKWQVYYPGVYTISVDCESMTLSLTEEDGNEPYRHIYLLGSASPNGWSLDDPIEMNHTQKNIFTYTGYLNEGELKFPAQYHPSNFDVPMLYAPTPNCAPEENGTYDIHSGAPDNKWFFPSEGEWQITIDITNTSISFVQL